ncbi:Wzz/FepE/Etk N-terminal domain-containing protein [Pedobacter xixiisoli]|uniref:Chain length determinant protein n=1 Tax=Pedobacter xixiisoli TaxID=1476464 RepID=A0A286AEK3_9SPHI|nr:Wzz/FepE/Etk N-terminal domain-containing protein [Pedobacter xixiisoli]SOD20334.1 Chain length determinant protein [Pedobacter xixiisoli]
MTNEVDKNNQTDKDQLTLREFVLKVIEWWSYFWSKKWTIIIAGLLGGIIGFVYAYTRKPVYTATTTFVLDSGEKSGGLGAYSGVASMMGIDLSPNGGGMFERDNILDLYQSRKMIEKTLFSSTDGISKKPLIEMYIDINKLREGWKNDPILKDINFSVTDYKKKWIDPKEQRICDSLIGAIAQNISKGHLNVLKPNKLLSKIQVEVKSGDEVFSKRFNEELVKNVNDFYIQTKIKKSLANVTILQHKTDSVRAVMNGAIYNAVAISDATPNLNPTRQVQRIVPIQKAQVSTETNKAILGTLIQNLEMAKMSLLKEAPLIEVIDGPVYPLLKTKKSKIIYLLIGSIAFGFLTIIILIVKRVISSHLPK